MNMIYELLAADPLYLIDKEEADKVLNMLRNYKFKQRDIKQDSILEYFVPTSIEEVWDKLSDESRVIAYAMGYIAFDKFEG